MSITELSSMAPPADARAETPFGERPRLYRRDAVIDAGGCGPAHLSTVHSGWIGLSRPFEDGRLQLLHIYLPGDQVGGHRLGKTTTPYQLMALTDAQLRPSSPSNTPTSGLRLIEEVLAFEDQLMRNLVRLGRLDAIERVADLLLELYERQVQHGDARDGRMPFPVTQQVLADLLGLSVVHVNRCLRSLRDRGLATVKSAQVILHDLDGLRRLACVLDPTDALRPSLGAR